jgi:hypothetical protein
MTTLFKLKRMKRLKAILTCGLLIAALTCCQKASTVNEVPDEIIYSGLNKTLININKDSIIVPCSYILFEIYRDTSAGAPDTLSVRIRQNSGILADCGNTFLNKTAPGYPVALSENAVISDIGVWGSSNQQYNLSDFSGKGEKFLGMVTSTLTDNVLSKRYAWLRIRCSAGNDTLKLIDWAYNNTAYKSIKAGQMH